jgi:hypothetical protein
MGTARRSAGPEILYVADSLMVPLQQPKLLCSTTHSGVTCLSPTRRRRRRSSGTPSLFKRPGLNVVLAAFVEASTDEWRQM